MCALCDEIFQFRDQHFWFNNIDVILHNDLFNFYWEYDFDNIKRIELDSGFFSSLKWFYDSIGIFINWIA